MEALTDYTHENVIVYNSFIKDNIKVVNEFNYKIALYLHLKIILDVFYYTKKYILELFEGSIKKKSKRWISGVLNVFKTKKKPMDNSDKLAQLNLTQLIRYIQQHINSSFKNNLEQIQVIIEYVRQTNIFDQEEVIFLNRMDQAFNDENKYRYYESIKKVFIELFNFKNFSMYINFKSLETDTQLNEYRTLVINIILQKLTYDKEIAKLQLPILKIREPRLNNKVIFKNSINKNNEERVLKLYNTSYLESLDMEVLMIIYLFRLVFNYNIDYFEKNFIPSNTFITKDNLINELLKEQYYLISIIKDFYKKKTLNQIKIIENEFQLELQKRINPHSRIYNNRKKEIEDGDVSHKYYTPSNI